jgi:hypothetical protein
MLAYRLLQAQTQPEFQDVPEPHAGPGQVVVRVESKPTAGPVGVEMDRKSRGNKLDLTEGALTDATGFRPLYARDRDARSRS